MYHCTECMCAVHQAIQWFPLSNKREDFTINQPCPCNTTAAWLLTCSTWHSLHNHFLTTFSPVFSSLGPTKAGLNESTVPDLRLASSPWLLPPSLPSNMQSLMKRAPTLHRSPNIFLQGWTKTSDGQCPFYQLYQSWSESCGVSRKS